jgi:predicted MFS family arabinose efflux permease
MMGLLSASAATGTLIFLPGLAWLAEHEGWRAVVIAVGSAALILAPVAFMLMPESPERAGLKPFGADADWTPPPASTANPLAAAIGGLVDAARRRDFWLLFATFFVCGFTTNGLVGTHLISLCADHGLPEVRAAGLLALMGVFDLIGTTASGWLTDRYDPRKLLFAYYGLRGISLIYLPFSDFSVFGLSMFAVFYGLDWIATIPPTLRLATEAFGEKRAPIVFGWIVAGHQLGAASAALFAGVMRTVEGRYLEAFVIAGATGIAAAGMALLVGRKPAQGQGVLAAE